MVAASSSSTLTYQWYFNGTAISGATNPTYSITAVSRVGRGLILRHRCQHGRLGQQHRRHADGDPPPPGDTTPTITTQPVSLSVATEEERHVLRGRHGPAAR